MTDYKEGDTVEVIKDCACGFTCIGDTGVVVESNPIDQLIYVKLHGKVYEDERPEPVNKQDLKLIKRKYMKKVDLINGMEVKIRDGRRCIIWQGSLRDAGDLPLTSLSDYDNDLSHIPGSHNHGYDIVEIYGSPIVLPWVREEELTEVDIKEDMKIIAEKLGKDVKNIRIKD